MLAPAAYVGHLPDGIDFVEIAPILCAGVTTYKGLKETEVKLGQWVVISGVGDLGHVAIQYAKAMGLHVAAVDIADDKRTLGAEVTLNAAKEDATAEAQRVIGGAPAAC